MKGERLNNMIVFAVEKFNGKYDKAGRPYILHCFAVMYLLNSNDEDEQCAAIGHDLKEDCGVTDDDLRDIGMSEYTIFLINNVTKVPGESEEEYKHKVMSHSGSRRLKKADLQHNSDIRRLKGIRPKDIIRTIKYHEFYLEILACEDSIGSKSRDNT